MAVILQESDYSTATRDPLLPWLWSIKKALDKWYSGDHSSADLDKLLSDCITAFKHSAQYRNDIRFLKIWFIYLEGSEDFERVFREMEENEICVGHNLLYEWYAYFLEAKGRWKEANMVYQTGISRGAEPLEKLKSARSLFIDRMSERLNTNISGSVDMMQVDGSESVEFGKDYANPWSASTMNNLLEKIGSQMRNYDGYHLSKKVFSGKVALSSLKKSSRNQIIEIGGKKYQIKGCAGQGGFAQVYKAYLDSNPDDVIALKIQEPAFPWEFYMYRQLDQRIAGNHRSSFGFAHKIHLYPDCSILICDYLSHGTLQDAINSYVVTGRPMEELLCIYYTVEMLYMLETLHGVGIIHGDFKPDNLLMRYSRDELTEEGFADRSGSWCNQGLCLVDWGRGIDLHLFPESIEFTGGCRTSGFRCIEMQENKPWKFQVDTYGLCVIVHMMLHNSYMEIKRKPSSDGGYIYMPKLSFKRYWKVHLWENLFIKLLNTSPDNNNVELLQTLRKSFQDYILSKPHHVKQLTGLLAKQRASLCSA
ncbi:hypothetical protein SLA2020_011190 [Shorea laevis]